MNIETYVEKNSKSGVLAVGIKDDIVAIVGHESFKKQCGNIAKECFRAANPSASFKDAAAYANEHYDDAGVELLARAHFHKMIVAVVGL